MDVDDITERTGKTLKYLILAEKASAMRSFSQDLGGPTGHFGSFDYEIVHAHGHLMGLATPEYQSDNQDFKDRVKKWSDVTTIPWPLETMKWEKTYLQTRDRQGHKMTTKKDVVGIQNAAAGCDAIIIATDNDPSGEGDVLGQEIINAIGWDKPVYRLVFDDEHNAEEIKKALNNLVDVTDQSKSGAYQKGLARERFDYATMQLSRLATREAWGQNYDGLVRPGRLKSVIVERVYQQQRKRDQFKPQDQFQAIFVDENGNKFINSRVSKYDTRALAENDVKQLQQSTITVDQTKRKHTGAPKLFDLAQLGVVLNNAKPKQFLDTYQKLYEAGYASYPRTEDRAMTKSQWDQLGGIADAIADVVGVDKSLLTNRQARKPYVSDKELVHGCNRPGLTVPTSLQDVQNQFGRLGAAIYDVLARSYLAALAPDYEYDSTTAFVTDYPKFTAHKNVPVKPGYKAVLGDIEKMSKTEDKKDEEQNAQFGKQATPEVYKTKTTPPQKPTRKFVLNYLTKENVGTGATRLSTLAQLMDGKHVLLKEQKNQLVLTPEGVLSGAILQDTMLASTKITKQLNEMMKQVGEFKIPLDNIYKAVNMVIQNDRKTMHQNALRLDQDSYLQGKLPKKSGNQAEKIHAKLPDGTQIAFKDHYMDHAFTKDEVQELLHGRPIKIKVTTKKKAKYQVSGRLSQQTFVGRDKKKITYWGFEPNWKDATRL